MDNKGKNLGEWLGYGVVIVLGATFIIALMILCAKFLLWLAF